MWNVRFPDSSRVRPGPGNPGFARGEGLVFEGSIVTIGGRSTGVLTTNTDGEWGTLPHG